MGSDAITKELAFRKAAEEQLSKPLQDAQHAPVDRLFDRLQERKQNTAAASFISSEIAQIQARNSSHLEKLESLLSDKK